jgi:transcriptional regulator with XRE-family HTH domain
VTRRTGLAKELRRIRIERGLRRAELAELAGVDARTVDSIESEGNVGKVKTIEALAAVLNTDVGPLLELRQTAIRNRARTVRRRLTPLLEDQS